MLKLFPNNRAVIIYNYKIIYSSINLYSYNFRHFRINESLGDIVQKKKKLLVTINCRYRTNSEKTDLIHANIVPKIYVGKIRFYVCINLLYGIMIFLWTVLGYEFCVVLNRVRARITESLIQVLITHIECRILGITHCYRKF